MRDRRRPTFGAEPKPGNTVAPTGATGVGFGLTTGGGGTGGYLDVANFCCPEYLDDDDAADPAELEWAASRCPARRQVRFTVQRDGRIADVSVEKPSGYFGARPDRATRVARDPAAAARCRRSTLRAS